MANKSEKLLRDSRTPPWKLVKQFILTLLTTLQAKRSQLKNLNKSQLRAPIMRREKRRKKIKRRNERWRIFVFFNG